MSRVTQSVLIFGTYMIAQGATLMLAPNLLLGILGFHPRPAFGLEWSAGP